jgi:hypothetical protein
VNRENELTMREASWLSEICVNSSGKITRGNLSCLVSVKDQSEHSEALDALLDLHYDPDELFIGPQAKRLNASVTADTFAPQC